MQACFKEGSPAGIKAVLALQGKIDYYLRLPLTRVSPELQNHLKELLKPLS
jgi:4-hydroxy-tetrahydrodipicolinate synthase